MIEAADEEFLSVVVKEEQKNLEVLLLCVQHQQRDQRLSSDNLFDKLWLGCPVNIVEGGDGVLLCGLFKQPDTFCVSMYWFQISSFRRELVSRLEMT